MKDSVAEKIRIWQKFKLDSQNMLYPDFVIECEEGEEIPCHRLVLAQSEVFRAMFDSNLKEASEKKIKLEYKQEVLEGFVKFFYDQTLSSDILVENCEDFLDLAEQYDLGLLKLLTEEAMIEKLTKDKMVDFYLLGSHFNAVEIKTAAKKCLLANKASLKKKGDLSSQLKNVDSTKIVELMQMIL